MGGINLYFPLNDFSSSPSAGAGLRASVLFNPDLNPQFIFIVTRFAKLRQQGGSNKAMYLVDSL